MEIGSSVGSDAKFGGGRSLCYDQAEENLYLTKTSWGDSYLMMMDQQGQMTQVSREFGAVTGFDVAWTADGRKQILLSAMRGQHLTELYLLDPDSGEEEKLTGFHDEYLETHQVVEPERFRYESKNGYEMEAYVIHPADYVPGKKYPAVFEIHKACPVRYFSMSSSAWHRLAISSSMVIRGDLTDAARLTRI